MPPKGSKMPDEVKRKIAKTLKGHSVSDTTRKKISQANSGENHPRYGKALSERTKRKIGDANRGREYTPEQRQRMSDAHKGKRLPDEQKRKISASMKGRPTSDEHRRNLSKALTGKHLSEETKRKVGEASRGRTFSDETRKRWSEKRSGAGNPAWRGGISYYPYCPKFNFKLKEEIREAYGRRCAFPGCGKSEHENGERLSVHHINFDKKAGCFGRPWNLVPLCRSCHAWTSEHRWEAFCVLCNIWVHDYIEFCNEMSGLC